MFLFSAIIQFFFRVPLNVLVCTPWGTRTPGWETLSYPDDGSSRPHETLIQVCQTNCFTPTRTPPTSELFSYIKKQKTNDAYIKWCLLAFR